MRPEWTDRECGCYFSRRTPPATLRATCTLLPQLLPYYWGLVLVLAEASVGLSPKKLPFLSPTELGESKTFRQTTANEGRKVTRWVPYTTHVLVFWTKQIK